MLQNNWNLDEAIESILQIRPAAARLDGNAPWCPLWKVVDIDLGPDFPMSAPATLYYCDSMECVQKLFSNPILAEHMDFTPKLVFEDADATVQLYNEMMSGNWASETQVRYSIMQILK